MNNAEINQAADEILDISICTLLSGDVEQTHQQALILIRASLIDEFGISIEQAAEVTRHALLRRVSLAA